MLSLCKIKCRGWGACASAAIFINDAENAFFLNILNTVRFDDKVIEDFPIILLNNIFPELQTEHIPTPLMVYGYQMRLDEARSFEYSIYGMIASLPI